MLFHVTGSIQSKLTVTERKLSVAFCKIIPGILFLVIGDRFKNADRKLIQTFQEHFVRCPVIKGDDGRKNERNFGIEGFQVFKLFPVAIQDEIFIFEFVAEQVKSIRSDMFPGFRPEFNIIPFLIRRNSFFVIADVNDLIQPTFLKTGIVDQRCPVTQSAVLIV